jgi:hypothetical protein
MNLLSQFANPFADVGASSKSRLNGGSLKGVVDSAIGEEPLLFLIWLLPITIWIFRRVSLFHGQASDAIFDVASEYFDVIVVGWGKF